MEFVVWKRYSRWFGGLKCKFAKSRRRKVRWASDGKKKLNPALLRTWPAAGIGHRRRCHRWIQKAGREGVAQASNIWQKTTDLI